MTHNIYVKYHDSVDTTENNEEYFSIACFIKSLPLQLQALALHKRLRLFRSCYCVLSQFVWTFYSGEFNRRDATRRATESEEFRKHNSQQEFIFNLLVSIIWKNSWNLPVFMWNKHICYSRLVVFVIDVRVLFNTMFFFWTQNNLNEVVESTQFLVPLPSLFPPS